MLRKTSLQSGHSSPYFQSRSIEKEKLPLQFTGFVCIKLCLLGRKGMVLALRYTLYLSLPHQKTLSSLLLFEVASVQSTKLRLHVRNTTFILLKATPMSQTIVNLSSNLFSTFFLIRSFWLSVSCFLFLSLPRACSCVQVCKV